MKKSRYTEEQIAFALKQAETGTPVAEVIRRMGVSEQTLPLEEGVWRAGRRRAAAGQAARGREPQAEAACGGPEPGQAYPAGCPVKKALTPGRRREIVAHVQASHGVSERRSCLALGVDRSSVRYVSHKPDQTPLRLRIHDLAAARVRYGYFRIYLSLIHI